MGNIFTIETTEIKSTKTPRQSKKPHNTHKVARHADKPIASETQFKQPKKAAFFKTTKTNLTARPETEASRIAAKVMH